MFMVIEDKRNGVTHFWCPECDEGVSFLQGQPKVCPRCLALQTIRITHLKASIPFRKAYYKEGSDL